ERVRSLLIGHTSIEVIPNLFFFKGTNQYTITIEYRTERDGTLGAIRKRRHPGSWILVYDAPPLFGDAFISYKEPEDLQLAEQLKELCKRAGFVPYTAPADIRTGS